jgi:sialate O-acetylesterase
MRRWMVLLAMLALGTSGFAELKLAALFSDGMVLQRDQEVPVWGWADPGSEVTVSFAGADHIARAGADGKFMIRLKRMKASVEPQSLVAEAGEESIEVQNILIGEVWLCSGQSNMQWPVERSHDFENEKTAANYPLIRMFLTDLAANTELQKDCTGSWKVCTPETVGEFSATAYFFGRDLHNELDVPIGLIRSCWGGTRIEAWSPMDSLRQYPSVVEDKAQLDQRALTFDETVEEERYAAALEQWQEKERQAKAEGKKPPRKPRLKAHPHKNQNYPANLYNAMIHPLIPYGMRGAIWYQGEANAHAIDQAIVYRDLLENMVSQWRKDWDNEFPFYAVQLVNFKKPQVQPVEDTPWAFIRESFLKFHKEVPNAGIAVGIDVGAADDIHPKNKQAIGYRLAQQALAKSYGIDIISGGPIYKSMKKNGNQIIIQFDDVGSGLVEQGGEPLKTFAIAGEDKQFVAAHAVIVDDTVIVSATEVPDPVAVRYAWADNPVGCNLFNKEGLPASPFRTDGWAPVTE